MLLLALHLALYALGGQSLVQGPPHALFVPLGIILLQGHPLVQCVMQVNMPVRGPLPVSRARLEQHLILGPTLAPIAAPVFILQQGQPFAHFAQWEAFAAGD